jgi:FixJ family two-component response regulator
MSNGKKASLVYFGIAKTSQRINAVSESACYLPGVKNAAPKRQLVAVVDDDESVRSAIHEALKSVGLTARSFGSADEFLNSGIRSDTACLITDVQMPGMSGLDLQAKLAHDGDRVAIIFITAYGEEWMRTQAMRAGAIEFLDKPFDDNVLLETVFKALNAELHSPSA